MAYSLEKLVMGGFLSFAEAGTTVDTETVAIDAQPDDDPLTNYSSLGCISEVNFEPETETDTDSCPSAGGGYEDVEDERVIKDILKFQTRDHSEPFWRLLLGVTAAIVDATDQVPFNETRRYIEGWLRVQGVGDDGSDRILMKIWGRLSIDANPKWSKDPTKPALKFQKIYSSIAVVTPTNITS